MGDPISAVPERGPAPQLINEPIFEYLYSGFLKLGSN